MRIRLFSLLLFAWAIPGMGSDLVNFEIVNSSSFSTGGGVFTQSSGDAIGPGTFSGWFVADLSQINTIGAGIDLTSWDISTTGNEIGSGGSSGFNIQFTPTDGQGFLVFQTPQSISKAGSIQVDDLDFQAVVDNEGFSLILYLIEPAGTFQGGVAFNVTETDFDSGATQSDLTGSGLVLDPAVFSPEPGGLLLMAAGLVVLTGARRRRGSKRLSAI